MTAQPYGAFCGGVDDSEQSSGLARDSCFLERLIEEFVGYAIKRGCKINVGHNTLVVAVNNLIIDDPE